MLYLNWCFASSNKYFGDKIMLYLNWCFASNNAYFGDKIYAYFREKCLHWKIREKWFKNVFYKKNQSVYMRKIREKWSNTVFSIQWIKFSL